MTRLVLLLVILAVAGIPLVAYVWETLNELLSGQLDPRRLALTVPVLVLFISLLALLGRVLRRMEGGSTDNPDAGVNRGE